VLICGKSIAYSMKQLQPEELFILACAKIEPSAEEIDRMNNLIPQIKKWDYTLKLAIENGMAPLVYKKIPLLGNGSMVPEGVKEKLSQTYLKTLSRNMVLYEHFRQIATEFSKVGIDVIPLKGIYLAEFLYKDIGLRQMSDIDLLVRNEDATKSIEILENLGYQKSLSLEEFIDNRVDHHHLTPMIKCGVSIEVHTKLHRKSEDYSIDINGIWSNSIDYSITGCSVKAMDFSHLIIHNCVHLDKHFKKKKYHLKSFIDISLLVGVFREKIDWNAIDELCENYMCKDILHRYLVIISTFLDANVSKNISDNKSCLITKEDYSTFVMTFRRDSYHLSSQLSNTKIFFRQKSFKKIIGYIFPPAKYMTSRYNVKPIYLPFMYLKRFLLVILEVLLMMKRKIF
jgi:hypothetical protein